MTFLEPLLLWGLPLISIPVIIHLMNRMRHKPKKWAAMEFLFMAKRSSTKISNLRNILILLCRCLVILFFILALARPLAGSFLGWSVTAPDTIYVLLDRSASMGSVTVGAEKNRLEKGIENIIEAAKSIPGTPQYVVIDSIDGKARSINDINLLKDELLFGLTHTQADITAMLNSALMYAIDNKTGNSEVWIVSDMQKTNWQPSSENWKKLMTQFNGLDQKMAFKVLSMGGESAENASIKIVENFRRNTPDGSEIQLTLEIRKSDAEAREIPVTFSVNEVESTKNFLVDGQSLTVQHTLLLEKSLNEESGFGLVSIPADGNLQDNEFHFAFEPAPELKASLAVKDSNRNEFLQIASAPAPEVFKQSSKSIKADSLNKKQLQDTSLLVIDGVEINEKSETAIKEFIEEGGNVLLFPSGRNGETYFNTVTLGETESVDQKSQYRLARWDEDLGPFVKSPSGESLPLKNIAVKQRQTASGKGQILANYEDGTGFLTRYNIGNGQLYYCSTLVDNNWSNLVRGSVLVPMLHRLQKEGAKRLSSIKETSCGDNTAIENAKRISNGPQTSAKQSAAAGVFQNEESLIVLNRPDNEDNFAYVEGEELQKLFGAVSLNLQEAVQREDDSFKTKLWTPLMIILFLFFLIEGWLTKRQKAVKDNALPETVL